MARPVRQQTPARQAALKIALRRGVVAPVSCRDRQSIQRRGDAPLIAQLLIKGETLLQKAFCRRKVSLGRRQGAEELRHPGSFLGMSVTSKAQNRLQPGTAFGQVFAHVPESKQRHTKTQAPVQIQSLKKPVESGTKIIDLSIALRQPARPVCGTQFGIALLRQDQTVSRMGPPRGGFLAAIGKAFEGIFANRLQHRETRLGVGAVRTLNQILIDQRRQPLETDRCPDRDWCCTRLPLPPACIRRQTPRAGETASARPRSTDRDSSRSFCEGFVAVRAGRRRRRSAIAGGFAADPESRRARALWFGRPPVRLPSGSPSSREQISRIAGAFSEVIAKSGQTAAARCTNSSVAESCASGATGNSCSP